MGTIFSARVHPALAGSSPSGFLARLVGATFDWQERARQRWDLRGLDDRMLADIGVSRADVERECTKPFWRL
jgi:uncharacterized protein YjiS (DUF1127 family)